MLREKLAVGRIGAPKGVHGDLKITSYSGSYEHFMDLEVLELAAPETDRPRDAAFAGSAGAAGAGPQAALRAGTPGRSLRLKVIRSQMDGGQLMLAFEGYESPEKARELTGMDILLPRAEAAPLGPNEWYRSDLIGLELRGPAAGQDGAKGPVLATVTATIEGGPDICLEASLIAGGKALVPFRKEFVGGVHLEEGWIELLAPWILG